MKLIQLTKNLESLLGDFYNPVMDILKVIGVLVVSFIIVKVGSFVIKKIFEKQKSLKYHIETRKIDTMATLALSAFRYTVYIVASVSILTDVFNLKSVLAAAGVGGVAIGFGAQSLIKDMISGFFIVMENQFGVGDLITIDNMTGIVEGMELRVTKARNSNGDLYIIPNGEIKKVTNHTRGNKSVVVDIPVSYGTDIRKVAELAEQVCKNVVGEFNTIVEAPKVLGITELGKDYLTLRITAKTYPNQQYDVERRIRRLMVEALNKTSVESSGKN